MSSAPRYYTNGRVPKSAAEEACHQGETPRGSRHPRKPQGSRAESGSRWVVELVEDEMVELLFVLYCGEGPQVRDRSPPLTPADGHHRCFWLRHHPRRAQCARRHQASTPVRRAACCADGFLWLSSRGSVLRPGGWENMCRLMCHCVRHISLDNKHGRSVEAIHSSRHVGRPARSSVPANRKSRTARRARWGARTVRGASGVT